MEQNASKQIKIGVILSYVFVFFSFIINFIYSPILTRYLGQNHYGTYSLVISIVGYLEILNNGMASTYIKFAAKSVAENEKLANINGVIFVIYMIFACISIIIGIILIVFLNKIFINFSEEEILEMQIMLIVMLFNIVIVAISGLFESYVILKERFIFQKLLLILKKVLLPILTIPLLIIGYKSIMVVIVTTLINLCMLVLNMSYCFKKLNIEIKFKRIEKKLLKEIFVFYIFVIITIVIDQINWSIDSIIIGMKRNAKDVAIYTIASQINSIYMTLATTISGVFVPKIHFIINQTKEESEKNEKLLGLVIKTGRIQCMTIFMFLFGFLFFGKRFIILLYGSEYELAYVLTLLLIIPISFVVIKGNLLEIYRAKDKQKIRTLIYLGIAIINATVSYLVCGKYGIVASTLGTTISIIIGHIIIFNIYDHKVIKINMIKFWKSILKIVPSFILPIITGLMLVEIMDFQNIYIYLLSMFIFSVIYILNIYFIALNKQEKATIQKIWNSIRFKICCNITKNT